MTSSTPSTPATPRPPDGPTGPDARRVPDVGVQVVVGVVLLVEALAVGQVLAITGRARLEPVITQFGVQPEILIVVLAQVDVAQAGAALLAIVGLLRLAAAVPRIRRARSDGLASDIRTLRWIEVGLTWPIVLFLLALANGIATPAALVPIYALATAPALLAMLQERVEIRRGHRMLPLAFASALGIVPWGVVAFIQLGAGVSGLEPRGWVRDLTLVMLAVEILLFVLWWREHRRGATEHALLRTEAVHAVVTAVAVSVFAWVAVAAATTPPVT